MAGDIKRHIATKSALKVSYFSGFRQRRYAPVTGGHKDPCMRSVHAIAMHSS